MIPCASVERLAKGFHVARYTSSLKQPTLSSPLCLGYTALLDLFIMKMKIHSSSCETEGFVETHRRKLCVTPAVRSDISSKLIVARFVVYSDRVYYWMCILDKDVGQRLPLELQCSLYLSLFMSCIPLFLSLPLYRDLSRIPLCTRRDNFLGNFLPPRLPPHPPPPEIMYNRF